MMRFRARTRVVTRVRAALAAAMMVTLMLVFQLYTSTRRTNTIVETMYASKTHTFAERDLRILIVGLIYSLQEITEEVAASLAKLCSLYEKVEIHIVHGESSKENVSFRQRLEQSGCRVGLVPQEDLLRSITTEDFQSMNRFEKLALLRTRQRQEILNSSENLNFDAVINLDLDVTDFSPLDSLMQAVHYASDKNRSTIVCASGYETWYTPWGKARLYYDTLAAIDADGTWWYNAYAANLGQILTFGQARLLDRLLQSHSTFAMQSCFGGLAVYDYATWSIQECDYTTRIMNEWQLSSDYTLPSGDACEHVVFQQCLRNALLHLEVGIQPNLLIGRDAALFSTREAKVGLFKITSFLVIVCFGCRKAWRRLKLYPTRNMAHMQLD